MSNPTNKRLQLLANGYHPLPNKGKAPVAKDWNGPEFLAREMTPERIKTWVDRFDAPSTGIRLDNGVIAVDGDVDDKELSDLFWNIIEAVAPRIANEAPVRFGGGEFKCAFFARFDGPVNDAFTVLQSGKYAKAEDIAAWRLRLEAGEKDAKLKAHRVEIFDGNPHKGKCTRQFGVYGPHSFDDNGKVEREYAWGQGAELADIPRPQLPPVTLKQLGAIIDRFDAGAVALGWEKVVSAQSGQYGSAVYDITPGSRFNTNRGGYHLTYEELCDAYALYGEDLRCSSNFMPGRGTSGNVERCAVLGGENRHNAIGVYVFGDETMHFPEEFKPKETISQAYSEAMRLLIESAATERGGVEEPPEPPATASHKDKLDWLLDSRAYLEIEDAVVRLFDTSLDCRVKPQAFARRYAHWVLPVSNGRSSKQLALTEAWGMSTRRKNLAGVRMNPEPGAAFPLYNTPDGRLFKNVYKRPTHPWGGTVEPFLEFMRRFLPSDTERNWLYDHMAHKWARPDIPGQCVIFVADTEDGTREGSYGTGRGLLFTIVHKLYGEDYSRSETFSMLDGSSAQSVYTDWLHGSLLITVDESKSSPTAYRRGERSAAYETLKDIVDPAPKRRSFKGKYKGAFDGMSYCTFWVATNHADVLAIPAIDRRFSVLRNGRTMTVAEVADILAWMSDPANIGALARWLAARDISTFNMQQPLITAGKSEMAEMALSDVEHVLVDLISEPKGYAFTKQHIEDEVGRHFSASGSYWRGELSGAWNRYCMGLKGADGTRFRVRSAGTRRQVFCFRAHGNKVADMPDIAIRREVSKWGQVDGLRDLLSGVGDKSGPSDEQPEE